MEQPVNIFSKEAIRARMMHNAATLWGLKNAQSLDPFVKLLIEAFSTEIFKVSNEVNNIKTRMLEKIARLLTPTIYTIPQPAHAIGFATPTEQVMLLNDHVEFFHRRHFPSSIKTTADLQIDLAFTPVDNIQLVKARVAAVFSGNTCSIIDEKMNKLPLSRVTSAGLPYATVMLAIEFDKDFEERLQHLSLYFSCPDFEHEEWIYTLLPYAEFFAGDHKLDVAPGLKYMQDNTSTGYTQIFNEYTAFNKIKDAVKNIYTNHFVTLTGFPLNIATLLEDFPKTLSSFGNLPEVATKLSKKYLWLTIKMPPQYNEAVLDNFNFVLNAFPVINRKWKKNECKFDIAGNNIPLVTNIGEHFLMVDDVADGAGRKYEEIPYSQIASLQKGLYSVRVSGMERFDERNAVDLINYVLELTRDEVAAYGNIERDKVVAALKEMLTQMKFLERKASMADGTIKQMPSYIIVEPYRDNEYMYASYWITNCTLANNLRVGLTLDNPQNTGLKAGLTLLTITANGSEAQHGMDSLLAYRYALTARDRIITVEDIKNFCRAELREHIKEITVKKGTAISARPKEGFIRTLEVIIIPADYNAYNENYWQSKASSLKQQVESKAVDGTEYRVFIKPIEI
jgi:hypothetical protein